MKLTFISTISTKCKLAVLFPSLCTYVIIHKGKCLEGFNININKTHMSCIYRQTDIYVFLCVWSCVCRVRESECHLCFWFPESKRNFECYSLPSSPENFCISVSLSVCLSLSLSVCLHAGIYIYVCMYLCVYVFMCMYICTRVRQPC